MNRIYRTILNHKTGTFVAAPENAKTGKASSSGANTVASARFVLKAVAASLMLAFGSLVYALPTDGTVSAGSATITGGPGSTTITQTSQNAVINWQSFSIGAGESVQFVQPNSSAVALNRVIGPDPSIILGSLSANGKVFLLNGNGILFGQGAQVNVGGLVASTLNLSDSDFMAGNYNFTGAGNGTIRNQGSINADGGYVALLGANVSNEGVISARLGTVALAAGDAITLDVAGDGLLNVTVDQSAVNALVQSSGMIQADGGQVLLTAQAAGDLLQGVVNNTGVIRAQTIENHKGTIKLLGNMQSGTVNVSGTLDASAPNGGDGGFIETSAAHVNIANDVQVTTAAPLGLFGTWLIDPQDFIIGPGGNISGATLSALLVNNSVIITTDIGPDTSVVGTPFTRNTSTPGNGDIFVNDAVSWNGAAAPGASTTLTLNAARDVNINAAITAVDGNLVVCCGRDVNVNAAITTTRGSVLLSAGNNVNVNAAMSTTDGNITMCAGNNINIGATLTLTNGTLIPQRSLGLSRGLVLSAGNAGTGPGVAGGTVIFNPATPATVTAAPTTIFYNPVSYTAPTDYSLNIIGSAPTQFMLVFPDGASKTFDGTTAATFTGLKGNPVGVNLVAGPGSTANFDTVTPGIGKTVSFTGYSLAGPGASNFALPVSCCGPIVGRTTADITPLPGGVAGPSGIVQTVPVLNTFSPLPLLASLNFNVVDGGVLMPPVEVVPTPIEPTPIEPTPTITPEPTPNPPPVSAPPKRPRKADRS